jgi:hypothetical protein
MPNSNNLFHCTLPDNWKESTIYTFEGPHDSGIQHNLVLVIDTKVPKKIALAEYAKIQFGTNKEVLPGFAMVNEIEKELPNGNKIYEIVYKYVPSDELVLFQKQIFMILEGKGYIFTATFTKKTLQTISHEVDEIISDFAPVTL